MIRNSTRYLSFKDRKAFVKDLNPVYTAIDEAAALDALDKLDKKWGKNTILLLNPGGIIGTKLQQCLNIRRKLEGLSIQQTPSKASIVSSVRLRSQRSFFLRTIRS